MAKDFQGKIIYEPFEQITISCERYDDLKEKEITLELYEGIRKYNEEELKKLFDKAIKKFNSLNEKAGVRAFFHTYAHEVELRMIIEDGAKLDGKRYLPEPESENES